MECRSADPCNSSYYIDSLPNRTIKFNKYALSSSEVVQLDGTGSLSTDCKNELYEINLLYSYSGWQLDPQYYISSAYLSKRTTTDSTDPTKKYLSFKWIYVDPSSVVTPPTNTFYEYFSSLWTPLKQKFGIS